MEYTKATVFALVCLSFFSMTIQGVNASPTIGFSGVFAPKNWQAGANPTANLVDISGAPDSIKLSNYPEWAVSGSGFTFTKAPSDGVISFSYSLSGEVNEKCLGSYSVGNQVTTLPQSGSQVSFPVVRGQTFGFALNGQNLPNNFGCTSYTFKTITLTISNFSFTPNVIVENIKNMLNNHNKIIPLPDIPLGANRATLKNSAYYAWQEFIALNWPAVKQEGKPHDREQADKSKKFGDPADASPVAYPALVWETFRHKVEIYPGRGVPPGYKIIDGKPNQLQEYGYDHLPSYQYMEMITAPEGKTPWINLDEVSQIGTNEIFTGLGPKQSLTEGPGRLLLFLAKANRTQYQYIASRGWWSSESDYEYSPMGSTDRTKSYIQQHNNPPAPQPLIGTLQNIKQQQASNEMVSFPSGTIELKAAWRLATADEQAEYTKKGYVSGYHANMIRYYTSPVSAADALGVLVGLHIIHKTPSAPYFIFASFEHKDNIRRADGTPLEDANGNIVGTIPSSITTSEVSTTVSHPQVVNGKLKLVVQTFTPNETTASTYTENKQSYFVNTKDTKLASDKSSQPKIGVNKRRFTISQDVIDANVDIHALIAKANSAPSNPWGNYRLTNVQTKPVTKVAGKNYEKTNGVEEATYYMSNSVVETNHVLSKFSGRFFGFAEGGNTITDYKAPQTGDKSGETFKNVYHNSTGYLMGGCMGCHGNKQVSGSDFSFIFASRVKHPDVASNMRKLMKDIKTKTPIRSHY